MSNSKSEDTSLDDILDILREGKKPGWTEYRPSQLETRRIAQAKKLLEWHKAEIAKILNNIKLSGSLMSDIPNRLITIENSLEEALKQIKERLNG